MQCADPSFEDEPTIEGGAFTVLLLYSTWEDDAPFNPLSSSSSGEGTQSFVGAVLGPTPSITPSMGLSAMERSPDIRRLTEFDRGGREDQLASTHGDIYGNLSHI